MYKDTLCTIIVSNINFGVNDARKCAYLDDHLFQNALLIWKNVNVLLTYPMLQMNLPSSFKRHRH